MADLMEKTEDAVIDKPATPATVAPGTDYVILRQTSPGQYEHVANVNATSAQAALRGYKLDEGTYIATPARSFKPVKLVLEKTERIKFEDA